MKINLRALTCVLISLVILACNLGNLADPGVVSSPIVPEIIPSETSVAAAPTLQPESSATIVQSDNPVKSVLIPCDLVTPAEVENILKEPASPPKEMSGGCTFTNAKDGMYAFTVAAAQEKETSGILQGQVMLLGFAGVPLDQAFMGKIKPLAESLDFKEFFTEVVAASKGSESVKARLFTGGGNDLVYWAWLTAQNRRQGAFVAARGNTLVSINLVVADTQTEETMLAASSTLANQIFTRLPEKFSLAMPTSNQSSQPEANIVPTQVPVVLTPTPDILPAPELVSPENGSVFTHYPRKTTLVWSPVPGAVKYEVEIQACTGVGQSNCFALTINERASREVFGTSYNFSFVGAQPGQWRVWAVDDKGQAGTQSDWWTFRYTK
jgi:hypothetical protein